MRQAPALIICALLLTAATTIPASAEIRCKTNARETICIDHNGDRWSVGRDYRGALTAKNLNTGQRITRNPDYNGRTAEWDKSGGDTVARERRDYKGRTVINDKTCRYTNRMEYVCK